MDRRPIVPREYSRGLAALRHGFFDFVVQVYQTLEPYSSVVTYFDRAVLYTIRGYEDVRETRLKRTA